MTAEQERAAVVAKGLSKAQREAMLSHNYGGSDMRHQLERKYGLFIQRSEFWLITPLGLAVREHLRDGDDA